MRAEPILDGHGYLVRGLLNEAECQRWVRAAEGRGFEQGAPITTAAGFVKRPDVRNNERAMWDDVEAAAQLWSVLRPALPEAFHSLPMHGRTWRSVGLNERLRLYRYGPGQHFRWHADGTFRRSAEEMSLYTLLVYLSSVDAGGETQFHGAPNVVPEAGLALVFWHPLLHQGAEVQAGTKLVLRSDVMFRC